MRFCCGAWNGVRTGGGTWARAGTTRRAGARAGALAAVVGIGVALSPRMERRVGSTGGGVSAATPGGGGVKPLPTGKGVPTSGADRKLNADFWAAAVEWAGGAAVERAGGAAVEWAG